MENADILRWAASATGMVAALMVAANAGPRVTGIGFVIFCVSSIIWIVTSIIGGNSPLAIQNVVLLGINLFGVYRYLWRHEDGSADKEPSKDE